MAKTLLHISDVLSEPHDVGTKLASFRTKLSELYGWLGQYIDQRGIDRTSGLQNFTVNVDDTTSPRF